MYRSDSHKTNGPQTVTEGTTPPLGEVVSRAFRRERLLAQDPYLIRNSEDRQRAAENPYRTRGPYAMVSRHFS